MTARKIKRVYVTHTAYCSGWDLDAILQGTIFRKAMHTNQKWEAGVKMLDWDFQRPNPEEHIHKAREYDFELIMAPDVWAEKDVKTSTEMADRLLKYTDRVVIPVHYFDDRLKDYELAYPNARKFNPKAGRDLGFISEFADYVTHILGGSPHSQLQLAEYFPKVISLDGNLMFWCAVRYGKYWTPTENGRHGRWTKPDPPLTNEECFRRSVKNLNNLLS